MQAIILAGGVGSRLGSRVKSIPKPLLAINDAPFLNIIVDRLIEQGVMI